MANPTNRTLMSSELLSQTAQQRLIERVAAAGGNISSVAQEVNARLTELDRADADPTKNIQADRAFMVAQLAFLSALEQKAAAPQQDQDGNRSWFSRLRMAFRRNAQAS